MSARGARVGRVSAVRAQAPSVVADLLRRPSVQIGLAALFYFAVACFFTWPMAQDPFSIIYAGTGDPIGTMAIWRELAQQDSLPILPGTLRDFGAPEGMPIPWQRNLASAPGVMLPYLLTKAFSPAFALGAMTLLGYTVSGTAMFAFARRLTGAVWPSLIAGWAFAFFPFALIKGFGHYDFVWGGVLVLAIWAMIGLMERPTVRRGFAAGAVVSGAMTFSPYFILFGGVLWLTLAVVGVGVGVARHDLRATLRGQAAAAVVVVGFLGMLVGLASAAGSDEATGVRTAGIDELNTYSARPWEYVVPPAGNPWVGDRTGPWLNERIHGSNPSESTLYVGLSVILLAAVALLFLVRRRLPAPVARATIALALVALVALLCSAPPQGRVLGVTIPFPLHFISEITTTWRVYSRFVIVVMACLAPLAAIGLWAATRTRPTVWRYGILTAATAIVILDLWGRLPEPRVNRLADPAIMVALDRQPARGIVAEYPMDEPGYGFYTDLYYQQVYGLPVLGGYGEGTVADMRAQSLTNLEDPLTARRLWRLGVRYVLLRNGPAYSPNADPGTPTKDFRFLDEDVFAKLYAVRPRARAYTFAYPLLGFGGVEPDTGGRWITQEEAEIALEGVCRSTCRGTVSFRALSFNGPRTLTVRDAKGDVVLRTKVEGWRTVKVPVRVRNSGRLRLETSPGPASVSEALGGKDDREVSVQVADLRFTRDR